MLYSVDHIEEGHALLVDEAGKAVLVSATALPPHTTEGDMLCLEAGVYHAAPQETARRREEIGDMLHLLLKHKEEDAE